MSTDADIKAVSDAINEENGLCVEIILFAMMHLKRNPNVSIEDAINYGFDEWIK